MLSVTNTLALDSVQTVYGKDSVCILNTDDCSKSNITRLNDKCTFAANIITDNFLVNADFIISSPQKSLYSLPEALAEVKHTKSYKSALKNESGISVQTLKQGKFEHIYPIDLEEKLLKSISHGDFNEAKGIITMLFQSLSPADINSKNYDVLIYAMISTLIRASAGNNTILDFNKIFSDMQDSNKTVTEIENCVEILCAENKSSSSDSLHEKIFNYVLENYSNPNLNINTIALNFGVTYSHISSVFKEHYKHSLVDFIHRYRLEKAKDLIEHTNSSIAEIAEKVGFGNIRTFNRIFKKYFTVTPTEYKNTLK